MRGSAKKRFGQHFLRDAAICERIVKLVGPLPNDQVVEIGAGDGALSSRIAPLVGRFLAVEVDRDCIPRLRDALSALPSAHVIQADILELNLSDTVHLHFKPDARLRMVGNLPYNIATAIIGMALRTPLPFSDMTFMVQLEVAERIVARPGSKQFGVLSVQCQHHARVGLAFKVPPACFVPRPKVMSAVITVIPRGNIVRREFETLFSGLIQAAFGHRRKTLINSLRFHPELGGIAGVLLEEAGIDGSRRPEDLDVSDYEHLASTLLARRHTTAPAGLRIY
jgi:16S rRNA (adenine1518-N6/adenine1519-N6)-dimethyltransferase